MKLKNISDWVELITEKLRILTFNRKNSLIKTVLEYYNFTSTGKLKSNFDLPPVVKSLYGVLADKDVKIADYKKYLEEKYL